MTSSAPVAGTLTSEACEASGNLCGIDPELLQVPGPGTYHNGPPALGHGGYLFGKEAEDFVDAWEKETAYKPGPGQYDVPCPRGNGPA
jgi:hypothetical protein